MRFLVDARLLTGPRPSGVGEYAARVLHALFSLDNGDEYILLTTGRTRLPPERLGTLPPHVRHVHVGAPNRLLTAALAAGYPLERLAEGHGPFDAAFLPNITVGRPRALPYVLTVHDLSWDAHPAFYSCKMQAWHALARPERLIRNAAAVLTPSRHARQELLARFPGVDAARVEAVPHGIDAAFAPRRVPSDSGVRSSYRLPKRFALFMGTVEPRKNLHAAIDAVEAYRQETGDDLGLVVAGGYGWRANDVERRLADPRRRAWIRRLGYVDAAHRPALYRLASVCVLPSFHEGFGLPVLEAMACGTPVIASDAAALPEVAGNAAVLVNPYDPGEIVSALREILGPSGLADDLRRAGVERAAGFSWTTAAERVRNQLRNAASKGTAGA